ncbi:archease protein family domain-containing protein [Ditylenchus destructor]|nr:archease protein family domain-containing protein [Ditylenchus destructor]
MDKDASTSSETVGTRNKDEDFVEDQPIQYEYLDHTADVQLHSWGTTLQQSIEHVVLAMYAYMTTDVAQITNEYSMDFSASGRDLKQLVYNLLDECLYHFNAEPFFIARWCRVLELEVKNEAECVTTFGDDTGDGAEPYTVKIRCWGESFDLKKHPPGTEIKAITYSNLQVNRPTEMCDEALATTEYSEIVTDHPEMATRKKGFYNVFVIVDI